VLERKQIGTDDEGMPIMVDVVPSVKVLLDVHKLILAYIIGTPVAQGQDDIETADSRLREGCQRETAVPPVKG
jgi:hypothetical protein